MNRRRQIPSPPPALIRMAREDRTVIWPHVIGDPLAEDGREDAGVYVRRDIVRQRLAARSAWDVLPEPKPRGLGWLIERVGRWLSW